VRVALESRGADIVLSVADDGRGFDLDAVPRPGEHGGWGLMIRRERAGAIGAELRVESAPGSGTRIELMLSKEKWS
jgi:signal transduction histidine kinase